MKEIVLNVGRCFFFDYCSNYAIGSAELANKFGEYHLTINVCPKCIEEMNSKQTFQIGDYLIKTREVK